MNWFWKFLTHKLESQKISNSLIAVETDNFDINEAPKLSFTVSPAIGGTIIKVVGDYNQNKDRRPVKLYCINDGENISTEIGRIVAMEIVRM